jgi:hypothetical protein
MRNWKSANAYLMYSGEIIGEEDGGNGAPPEKVAAGLPVSLLRNTKRVI